VDRVLGVKVDRNGSTPAGNREVIDFISNITDTARLRVEEQLAYGFVRLKVAEAERRQAHHDIRSVEDIVTELVRNSRDAGAKNVIVASQKERGRYRRITVLDDGCGIPRDMHQVVFEPRVTSKKDDFEKDRYGVHGRGMALFSIRSAAADARIAWSDPGLGTSITLTADTEAVSERTDQATLPRVELSGEALSVGVGTHNVPRILIEMSIDCGTTFYLGSFSEALATARELGATGGRDGGETIWSNVARSEDAKQLVAKSTEIGLPVSDRNAYRVLSSQIEPLSPIIDCAVRSDLEPGDVGFSRASREVTATRRATRVRNPLSVVSSQDLKEVGDAVQRAVDSVLEAYFLKTQGPARVRRGRGRINISLHVSPEEEADR
jgi:anti-sigma regulatory factor (Ser/Thr protein kinase)